MLTRLPAFYFEYWSSSYNKQARAFALLKLEVVGLARLNLKVVLLIGLLALTFRHVPLVFYIEENEERREGVVKRGGKGVRREKGRGRGERREGGEERRGR